MRPFKDTAFRFGLVGPHRFSRTNTFGDWWEHRVQFDPPLPAGSANEISVIVTPCSDGQPAGTILDTLAVVCIASDIGSDGFLLKARNSDERGGTSSFYWLAVAPTPEPDRPPVDARLGILQTKHFRSSNDLAPFPNLWGGLTNTKPYRQVWPNCRFSRPLVPSSGGGQAILLTPNNLHVATNNPAAVGAVGVVRQNPEAWQVPIEEGFSLVAQNSDVAEGECGFYYAAFAEGSRSSAPSPSLWVDSGNHMRAEFRGWPSYSKSGVPGDWWCWDIYFRRPFLTPPIVLGCARDGDAPAVVLARNVTTHGFTMAARNSDTVARGGVISWIAIGCSDGCG